MDESSWKIIEMMMWLIGIQTTLVMVSLGFFWKNLSKRIDKIELRIEKLSEKVEDVDRRLCRIEGGLSSHGACLFNQSHERKAE